MIRRKLSLYIVRETGETFLGNTLKTCLMKSRRRSLPIPNNGFALTILLVIPTGTIARWLPRGGHFRGGYLRCYQKSRANSVIPRVIKKRGPQPLSAQPSD